MRNGHYFKLCQKGYRYITRCITFTADRDTFTLEELIAKDLNKNKKVNLSDLIIDGDYNLEITPTIIFLKKKAKRLSLSLLFFNTFRIEGMR